MAAAALSVVTGSVLRMPRALRGAAAAAFLIVVAVVGSLFPTPALAETWEAGVEQRPAVAGDAVTGLEPFEMIAVSWTGRATQPPPVQVHGAAGWAPILSDTPGPDAGPDTGSAEAAEEAATGAATEQFSEPVWVDAADGYRVGAHSGVGNVTVHLIRQERVLRPAVADEPAGAAPAPPDGPGVNLRSSWGASSAKQPNDVARSIRFAVVHHTVGTNSYTQADVPAILRGIQAFHQNSRGWNDIAYNFLIDRWGGIWEGRSGGIGKAVVGSHAAGFNTGTVGISLMGDFSGSEPTAEMLESTAVLAGWKLALAGVDPAGTTTVVGTSENVFPAGRTVSIPTIVGHRDVGTTDCPGRVWNHLAAIRNRAAQRAAYVRGNVDAITRVSQGQVRVTGWAYDTRSSDSVRIVVDVNGRAVSDTGAERDRGDVRSVFGDAPLRSGFDRTVDIPNESNDVCVYAAETSYGALTRLGCGSFANPTVPRGNYDALTLVPGGAAASGWAWDPNSTDPVDVQISVNGSVVATVRADGNRPDVAAAFPGRSAAHGFSVPVGLPAGRHVVCVTAINVGPGSSNTSLGCRAVGQDLSPIGTLDGAVRAGNVGVLYGWALDPETTGSIGVLFFVNDRMAWLTGANLRWPNLQPFFGGNIDHGFFTAMPLPPTRSNVCAYALNVGIGNPATLIGCRAI